MSLVPPGHRVDHTRVRHATHVNIRDGNLFLSPQLRTALTSAVNADLDVIVVTIWLLALAVILKYGDTLLG